jgi:homoserine kinase type II
MNFLSSKGIKCPTPIKNSSLNYIGNIKSKPAAILTFLEGESALDIKKDHTFEIGKVLAEMHLGTLDFPMKKINDLSISGWERLLIKNKDKINKLETNLFKKIENQIAEIKYKWPKNLPSGVIHADLFPDNVLFKKGKVSGLIDFYFSCNDFFIYDLCICINAWCFDEENKFKKDYFKNLLEGYQTIRKLEEEEINAIPVLCHASSLRFLLTRIDNWNNKNDLDIVNYQDPLEFLKRLEFHELNENLGNYI